MATKAFVQEPVLHGEFEQTNIYLEEKGKINTTKSSWGSMKQKGYELIPVVAKLFAPINRQLSQLGLSELEDQIWQGCHEKTHARLFQKTCLFIV